jgi:hypothetical protein
MLEFEVVGLYCIFSNLKRVFLYSIYFDMRILIIAAKLLPWIPEPSTVNNKLKRREGSGSTGRFFD